MDQINNYLGEYIEFREYILAGIAYLECAKQIYTNQHDIQEINLTQYELEIKLLLLEENIENGLKYISLYDSMNCHSKQGKNLANWGKKATNRFDI